MRRGFLYLVAIVEWWSRKVLAWRLSNTMDVDFCVEALEAALARHGKPEIFNTDQGSQFTSLAFTQVLRGAGVKISMDGKGRWMDNRASLRPVGPHRAAMAFAELRMRLSASLRDRLRGAGWDRPVDRLLQHLRPHSAFDGRTPEEVYSGRDASSRGHAPEMTPEALAA
ncbi:MAG: DDE-type integrase/transposase/recombinase [Nitrospirota bacterium]|jgi:putative transposase|nr:DDE-type integrase/transposase/recombinase [Nitrospirota bacterium]